MKQDKINYLEYYKVMRVQSFFRDCSIMEILFNLIMITRHFAHALLYKNKMTYFQNGITYLLKLAQANENGAQFLFQLNYFKSVCLAMGKLS